MITFLLAAPLMHSHNDYAQKRPFDEAWENNFDSLEVDVFPVDGKLLVGHDDKDLKSNLTIQSMYLDRLSKIQKEWNRQSLGGKSIRRWLLIDVKREGELTYSILKRIFVDYPDLISSSEIRFVISGDRAVESIAQDKGKFGGIDGRFPDLGKNYSFAQMPWISADWSDYFKWNGAGDMPKDEFEKMSALAKSVHKEHRLLRFWGSPDNPQVWIAEKKAGVDIINTDRLAELAKWRKKH